MRWSQSINKTSVVKNDICEVIIMYPFSLLYFDENPDTKYDIVDTK